MTSTISRPPAGSFPVVFSDLDGTLLDSSHSFRGAEGALALLQERGIPLVLCTSKTRAEVEAIRERLGNRHPFITENGGAAFVPAAYFPSRCWPKGEPPSEGPYRIVRFGAPYGALRDAVVRLREQGFALRGFGDMTVAQVAALTRMDERQAELARLREFDEPILFDGSPEDLSSLALAVRRIGLHMTRARYLHLSGPSDKERAARLVRRLFRAREGRVWTAVLGDGLNDLKVLSWADSPVAVGKEEGGHEPALAAIPGVYLTRAAGPAGWAEAIETMFGGEERAASPD